MWDAQLRINTHYDYPNDSSEALGHALDQPIENIMADLFHEFTHLAPPYTDDGILDIWKEAEVVEALWNTDLNDWRPVRNYKLFNVSPCD